MPEADEVLARSVDDFFESVENEQHRHGLGALLRLCLPRNGTQQDCELAGKQRLVLVET
jgi:hypothetical protein